MPKYFTGKGDDGTTGLLGGGRVPKNHPLPEAYGAVDEASAALGLARAMAADEDSRRITAQVQRDLYALMSELATSPDSTKSFQTMSADRVRWLEDQVEHIGERVSLPSEFIIGGDSLAGGAFDLARTVVRRAERRVAGLIHDGTIRNPEALRYLNRLSSLCFVLSLWENLQAGFDMPSLAREPDE
jgi:cob(I)alamin adenosyltransferase